MANTLDTQCAPALGLNIGKRRDTTQETSGGILSSLLEPPANVTKNLEGQDLVTTISPQSVSGADRTPTSLAVREEEARRQRYKMLQRDG